MIPLRGLRPQPRSPREVSLLEELEDISSLITKQQLRRITRSLCKEMLPRRLPLESTKRKENWRRVDRLLAGNKRVTALRISTSTWARAKLVEGSTSNCKRDGCGDLRYNAAREVYGYKTQAATDTAQAGLYKSAGINSLLAGISGAGSSVVGGAQSIAGRYAQWKLGLPPSSSSSGLGT